MFAKVDISYGLEYAGKPFNIFLRFGVVSSLIVFIYATNIQNVDPEEYGGIAEIIKEGFMTAFATFLV